MAGAIAPKTITCLGGEGVDTFPPGWAPYALNKHVLKSLLNEGVDKLRDELVSYHANEDDANGCAYKRRSIPVEAFPGAGFNHIYDGKKPTSTYEAGRAGGIKKGPTLQSIMKKTPP